MWEFLELLENSGFAVWVREAQTVFAYPTLIAFHSFGMAFLVGTSVGIALRTLGFASGLPMAPLEKFYRVIWIAFWVNAVSGTVLLLIDARNFLTMPAFYIKLLAIAAAVTTMWLLRSCLFGDLASLDTGSVPKKAKMLAGAALAFWAIAIAAGRVTAYDPFIQRETAIAVLILTAVMLVAGYTAFRFLATKKSLRRVRPAA